MVIYHYPKELAAEMAAGSALRPVQMAEAFRRIGEEVIEITGSGPERVGRARNLEARLTEDAVLYSESVNLPPAVTWLRRHPWHMNFDYRLIRRLHDLGVPTGLFYRDIYWVLEDTKAISLKSFVKKCLTPAFARRELRHYEQSLDVLFLPHRNMGKYIPFLFPDTEMRTLPPGGVWRELEEDGAGTQAAARNNGALNLLYVGNIAPPHYDLRPYVDAVEELSCATLDLVTRERAMEHHGHLYRFGERKNIRLAHVHGKGLEPFYQRADLALAVRDDTEYLAFAMPVKIFEAISFGVPLVVSRGLRVVAELVEREKIGWVIESPAEFGKLLDHLARNPADLQEARERVRRARVRHTWEARAREVVETLRNIKNS